MDCLLLHILVFFFFNLNFGGFEVKILSLIALAASNSNLFCYGSLSRISSPFITRV